MTTPQSITTSKFLVSENTIMWAFRYALGRRTGAVQDVCETLKENWNELSSFTKGQIKDEIRVAIRRDEAGSKCDIKNWEEILNIYY